MDVRHLAAASFAAYDELAERFEVIICEGAGSPAEINLRAGDYVNLGLARAKDLPVVSRRRYRSWRRLCFPVRDGGAAR